MINHHLTQFNHQLNIISPYFTMINNHLTQFNPQLTIISPWFTIFAVHVPRHQPWPQQDHQQRRSHQRQTGHQEGAVSSAKGEIPTSVPKWEDMVQLQWDKPKPSTGPRVNRPVDAMPTVVNSASDVGPVTAWCQVHVGIAGPYFA